jgi:hypothetical protein
MKKACLIVFLLPFFFFFLSKPVLANCQMLSPSLADFLACTSHAPGGTTVSWLYNLSSAEYQEMKKIIDYNNSLPDSQRYNFDVRLFLGGGTLPSNAQVDAFLADLLTLNSSTKINGRLVNEPNNLVNEGFLNTYGYQPEVIAKRVFEIYEHANATLQALQSGDRLSLGIALDHWSYTSAAAGTVSAKDFLNMMNSAAGTNVIDKLAQWDVVWMINAYIDVNNPTKIGQFRIGQLREDLKNILGVPEGMRIAVFEIGAIKDGRVTYDVATLALLFTQTSVLQDLKTAGVEWFTIFIQSPEGQPYSFFNLPLSVLEAFANFYTGKDPFLIGKLTEEEFQQLLALIQALIEAGLLVPCPDGGFATSLEECEKGATGLPTVLPFTKCVGASAETRVSRPDECTTCNLEPPLTYACATTFAVHDTVSWKWENSDFVCDPTGEHWVERDWGGTITIDAGDVKVPFVGKKGEEDVQKYLADYFEGTAFYYGPDINLDDCQKANPNEAEREACQEAVKRVVMEGGIFRKLAPKELQDELKEAMIDRAKNSLAGQIENGIHDYLIEHAGVSRRLSKIDPPPKLPVKAKEEEYQEWQKAYQSWKKTDSGKLWAAVPMFSREDSPGQVIASVNTKRADVATVIPPVQEEQVPHLARLFEVTRELRNLLMPWLGENEAQASSQTLLASSNPQVLGEKTQLAQAESCKECLDASIVNPIVNNGMVYATLVICHQCPGHDCVGDVSMGPCGVRGQVHSVCPGCFSSNHSAIIPPAPISCPGTASLCVEIKADRDVDPSCQGQAKIISCQVTVDANCNILETNCGGGIPEPLTCGLAEPMPYPACEYESITDENPNDTICCNPINIDLKAVDQFANPNYTGPCIWVTDPTTGARTLLNPDCKKTETRHVYREVKVDLFHPYLEEIWNQTTDSFHGLFNIFRPEVVPFFEDLDANSYIEYSYPSGSITPESPWKFYFPHLGGIQKAKEWVLETLNPSGGGGTTGRASPLPPTLSPTPTPATGPTTLNYTLDFRNPNISISEATKKAIIEAVKRYWPNTEIEERWDYVYVQAVVNGWNPAFVIALWIEESGAGHLDNWDLGCTAGEKNNITSQLFCLFGLPYQNAPFEEFMCRYSEGHYPCQFEINPNFPGNLKYWYDQLTQ